MRAPPDKYIPSYPYAHVAHRAKPGKHLPRTGYERAKCAGPPVVLLSGRAVPCGYGLLHRLSELGRDGQIVAPSLISRQAGDRARMDRRAECTTDDVQAFAWKAQKRLCACYRLLEAQGKRRVQTNPGRVADKKPVFPVRFFA